MFSKDFDPTAMTPWSTMYDGAEEGQGDEGAGGGDQDGAGAGEGDETTIDPEKIKLWGLEGIDEETQKSLAPHFTKIDASFTKKMQEAAEKIKPYEELGDLEEVKKQIEFVRDFQQDPQRVLQMLGLSNQGQQQGTQESDEDYDPDDPMAGLQRDLKKALA